MKYSKFQTSNLQLQKHIEYFNSIEGDKQTPSKFISLPEGKIGMVFLLDGICKVRNHKGVVTIKDSHVFGLVREPTIIEVGPYVKTFAVVFKPGGLWHYIPHMPVSEISLNSANLVDIFGTQIYEWEDRLYHVESDHQRIQLLESFLEKNKKCNDQRLLTMIQLITDRKGSIKLEELAREANLSKRQIRNSFNTKLGLSPKNFMRLIRFRHVLENNPSDIENYAQYATRMGYYDESHFIHEFKLLSGMTPKKYFHNLDYISDFYNYQRLIVK